MNDLRQVILDACSEHGMPAIRKIVDQALKDAQRAASRKCNHKYVQNRWDEGATFCNKCGWFIPSGLSLLEQP